MRLILRNESCWPTPICDEDAVDEDASNRSASLDSTVLALSSTPLVVVETLGGEMSPGHKVDLSIKDILSTQNENRAEFPLQ